ncbi:MAG TPA: hypothetical protein VFG54_12895 [Prolixibacteraceae bacterium]|nr:hypothetical protein [Prolixibacteraceae bacterium]
MAITDFIPSGRVLKRMLLLVTTLCCWNLTLGQDTARYSILVAGHAYGAHAGTNIGLHPPFLNRLALEDTTGVKGLFLTGDIVNRSTLASWAQIEKELTGLDFNSYYVMGNHDDNTIGHNVFITKHGALYYSFTLHNDLYIVLNSTESDRSISSTQLTFLSSTLQDASARRVFVFFHEVIWNSHERYRLVRSNSRSRYDQIKSVSNFWQEVAPMLKLYPERRFYLIAGDVGGNPDAIAASYDRWDNMTLLTSGMGEVPNENYLRVDIAPDTILFTLKALNSEVIMKPIQWYNIPLKPLQMDGPAVVKVPASGVRYSVAPVFNATAYVWGFPSEATGASDSASIDLSFNQYFQSGPIVARAFNDGFGSSDPVFLNVESSDYTTVNEMDESSALRIHQTQQSVIINCSSDKPRNAHLKVYNTSGKLLYSHPFIIRAGINTHSIEKKLLGNGLVIVQWSFEGKSLNQKMVLY